MDNRRFNVNGELHRERHLREKDIDQLARALELVIRQHGSVSVVGWAVIPSNGLVLFWTDPQQPLPQGVVFNKLLSPMKVGDSHPLAHLIANWLDSDEAIMLPHPDGDDDRDHDGHNGHGWRIYCDEWGHVAGQWSALCGVRHSFMWYGK